MAYCNGCGKQISEKQVYCENCTPKTNSSTKEPVKTKQIGQVIGVCIVVLIVALSYGSLFSNKNSTKNSINKSNTSDETSVSTNIDPNSVTEDVMKYYEITQMSYTNNSSSTSTFTFKISAQAGIPNKEIRVYFTVFDSSGNEIKSSFVKTEPLKSGYLTTVKADFDYSGASLKVTAIG